MKRALFALGASVLACLALTVAAVAGNGNDHGTEGRSVAQGAINDSSGRGATHNKIPGGTLVLTYSPCATNVGVSASGLVPESELWRYSTSTGWAFLGSVPSNGTTALLAAVAATGVFETWTAYAFPVGADPANDGIGSALITSAPLSFTTCLPPGLVISAAANCGVLFRGTGLVPGSVLWWYSTRLNVFWFSDTVDSTGTYLSLLNGGQSGLAETYIWFNLAAGYDPRIAGIDPNSPDVLFMSNAFATGGCIA